MCVRVHVAHVVCVLKQLLFGKLLTVRRTPTALEGCHCEECLKIGVGCS